MLGLNIGAIIICLLDIIFAIIAYRKKSYKIAYIDIILALILIGSIMIPNGNLHTIAINATIVVTLIFDGWLKNKIN